MASKEDKRKASDSLTPPDSKRQKDSGVSPSPSANELSTGTSSEETSQGPETPPGGPAAVSRSYDIYYTRCDVDCAYVNRHNQPEMRLVAIEGEDPLPLPGKPRWIAITRGLPEKYQDYQNVKDVRVVFTRPRDSFPTEYYRYHSVQWPPHPPLGD